LIILGGTIMRDDEDEAATTKFESVIVRGVVITSRWQKLAELQRMADALSIMPEYLSCRIRSMECDSKAGHSYCVTLRQQDRTRDKTETWHIARFLEAGFRQFAGGHNSISIDGELISNADWHEAQSGRNQESVAMEA
jgi:hypothetical protein